MKLWRANVTVLLSAGRTMHSWCDLTWVVEIGVK